MSGESSDSHDHDVRFISPESRRKIKNERYVTKQKKTKKKKNNVKMQGTRYSWRKNLLVCEKIMTWL